MECNVHRYFAPSNLFVSATNPGSACIAAEVRKGLRYGKVIQDYIFVPVVVETSGMVGQGTSSLFHEIGCVIARDRQFPSDVFFYFNVSLWPSSGEMHSQS